MNIIFAVCFIPILPILYFVFRNQTKPKKNLILGVTIPPGEHDNPQVKAVCRSFLKCFNIVMIPLFFLMIPPFFMTSMGFAMTWYMTVFIPIVIAPMIVFGGYNRKLLTVKRENGWVGETAGKALADIKAASIPTYKINGIWFLIPTLICFIPVVDSWLNPSLTAPDNFGLYLTFAIMTACFWLLYHMIFRVRSEVVNEDLTLTMALTRVRRYNWGKFWIVSVWSTAALNVLIWLFPANMVLMLTATLIYSLILIIIAIKAEFTTRLAQQKLTATDMGDVYVDEDDYWLWGLFYHNPNDNHFFVNARIGMNMSCNLAKTSGKVVMLISALLIAAMPFIGIWIWVEERTPTALVLTDTELIARHTRDQYTIQLADIESIEILTEMPWIISRDNGTSMDNLAKGRFSVSNHGTAFLCIEPNNPPFILIIANDRTYFLNDNNSSVTTGIYNEITSGRNSN